LRKKIKSMPIEKKKFLDILKEIKKPMIPEAIKDR
jgi:hypothetical protein